MANIIVINKNEYIIIKGNVNNVITNVACNNANSAVRPSDEKNFKMGIILV